jgi:hypothetical protein
MAQVAPVMAFGPGVESWPQGQLVFDCTPIAGTCGHRPQKKISRADHGAVTGVASSRPIGPQLLSPRSGRVKRRRRDAFRDKPGHAWPVPQGHRIRDSRREQGGRDGVQSSAIAYRRASAVAVSRFRQVRSTRCAACDLIGDGEPLRGGVATVPRRCRDGDQVDSGGSDGAQGSGREATRRLLATSPRPPEFVTVSGWRSVLRYGDVWTVAEQAGRLSLQLNVCGRRDSPTWLTSACDSFRRLGCSERCS